MYHVYRVVLGILFKLYYNPKIVNKEVIPKDGPILIAGNHKHVYDQCLTIIATKRTIRYMAKKEYFDNKKLAWFFKSAGCIPVDRSKKDNKSVSSALDFLNEGGAIGLFPEGTRNKTKEFLLPFKFGCVSMAKKTDAYIVPIGISGDYKFRSKNLVYRFGKPFKVTNMDLADANKRLENAIGNLMKKSYRESNKK